MKKLLLTLTLLLLVSLPLSAQDDLTADEIRNLAQRVVLIGIVENDELVGNGSGTIVTPTGLIFTNRHVVEDSEDLAIFMLGDVAELPELRYFARVVEVSSQIDFAIIQIDRDADGRAIDYTSLNLPYVDLNVAAADIGDEVRVFGYPGIGDGYMVITSGEVVTIQNGTVNGERVPVWYRTDTEFSGGNSGGLAVNRAGELVGIPTWVVTEDQTAGKLGGLLPFSTVLALVTIDNLQDISSGPVIVEEPQTSSGQSVLTLQNNSNLPICYVYISLTTATDWGNDQLGEQEIIQPGASRDWTLAAGYYDVLLRDCDGNDLSDTRNIDLNESDSLTYSGDGTSDTPLSVGPITVTCGESVEFDGVEILMDGVVAGEEYRVTVIGLNGFDPIMAVFNNSNEGTCSDDNETAASYKANLPATGIVGASERSAQVVVSRDPNSDSDQFSIVVGGYENATGEFLVIVEGSSITAADDGGDVFSVNLVSGVVDAAMPLTVYALSTDGQLDPMVIAVDAGSDPLNDAAGNIIFCDDAGKPDLCATSGPVLSQSNVSTVGGQIPGGQLDAALTISPDQLKSFSRQDSVLRLLVTSYDETGTGGYVIVFHMGNG